MEATVILIFVSGVEIYHFKAKNSKIKTAQLCLGNVSKDILIDNMIKTGLYRYGYIFSFHYFVTVDDI